MRKQLAQYIYSFRNWFAGIPAAQRFQRQHPRVATFIADRLDPEIFVGLPLTLLLLVALVNMLLLTELAESVLDAEWVVVADQKFTDLLYSVRSEGVSYFLYIITKLGEREAVFIVGGVLTIVLLYYKRYWAIVAFWLAMAGLGLSVRYGKTFISRARPADVAYYEVEHYSFPSGHATTAMALFGLLAYLLYRNTQSPAWRRTIVWAAILIIVLVGFSRIYLGVHFLSDVLAGYLLGFLWMLVGISLNEVMLYRKKSRQL
ncbi:phosphatase PAP2 family protein [Pontibacter sp. Tf4]|uniref:phosphatase PAP2 family protein n=1 Tax=Pontibacter sp. Tf4 TaxID=2761620 RepID=UPI00162A40FB|nr:phosphatase PAP2 family protein [Pontibacter sp. Tf4]MBB6611520.1 phosphatase PAP2 family protein [Pontibacter sp. Tf4]